MLDLTLMTILCWTATGGRDCMKRKVEQITHEPYRVCYYTLWSRYRPGNAAMHPRHVDPQLCSHIIIAFANVSPEGHLALPSSDEDAPIVEALTNLKINNSKLKIMIAVGGWNAGSEPFRRIIESEKSRVTFINSSLNFLKHWKLDGLDLDWEYPGVEDKQNFTILIKELWEAFAEESTVSKKPKFLLTAAVPGLKEKLDGYDVPQLNKYLTFLSVMTYDFHGPWDNRTGHNSPLFSHDGYNLVEGVKLWVDAGMLRSKVMVGLATYGHSFKLHDKTNPAVGASTLGGVAGNYTKTPGFFAFYEICEMLYEEETVVLWDHFAAVPYCYNDNTWVSFDDVRSLEKKVEWAMQHHYGGVMIWEMGMDDFSGTFCSKTKNVTYPLLKSINAAISNTKISINSLTPRAKAVPSAKAHPPTPSPTSTSTPSVDVTSEESAVSNGTEKCTFKTFIPLNCTNYLACVDGYLQELVCPVHLVFSEFKNECVEPREVEECTEKDVAVVANFNSTEFTPSTLTTEQAQIESNSKQEEIRSTTDRAQETSISDKVISTTVESRVIPEEYVVVEENGKDSNGTVEKPVEKPVEQPTIVLERGSVHWKNWKHN